MSWQERGACHGQDPELFFPISYLQDDQVDHGRRICRPCPVREECLDYALSNPAKTQDGLWGATTPGERRRLRTGTLERTAVR